MKKFMLKTIFTVILIAAPQTVLAQDPGDSEPGLSGSFQGGIYVLQTDSQLYVDDKNEDTDDLDGPADTYEGIGGLASIFLRYQFEGGTAIYAGNPLEVGQDLALSAGVTQPMGDTTLDMAVTWSPINEVWQNPYETAESRDETDMYAYGLRIKLLEIGGSPWEGTYNIDRIDIDNDEIGDLEKNLKRDGWKHELGAKYTLSLDQGLSFSPELSVSYCDIEGRSNSYLGINGGVLLQHIRSSWVFTGQVSGFYNQYQKTHPLFDKTRDEFGVTALGQVVRLNLFGVEPLFASFVAGYSMSDANIDFYDSQTVIGLTSVGINF